MVYDFLRKARSYLETLRLCFWITEYVKIIRLANFMQFEFPIICISEAKLRLSAGEGKDK